MTTVKGTLNVDEAVTLDSTLDVTGATNINDTTASTSTTTGALIVDGGVGIAQNLNVGRNLDVTGLSILESTLDVTGDTSVSTFDSSGATSLATGGGVVNVASTGVMTTVKGTLNVDEAVTLDTTLDVTGDTSVSTFDSSGATSIATGGGVVNIASDGVMTTVEGTLNVDEAVTLDSTLDVNGNVTSSGGSISGFDAALNDQTSTSYTLQSSDNGKVVTLNNASAITLTIPSSLGDGFNCLIVQKGDGQISLTASGTTLINRQSHSKTAGKYAVLSIVNIGSETIIVAGDTGS